MIRQLAIACLIYAVLVIQPGLGPSLGHTLFRPWLPGMAVVVCVTLTTGVPSLIWCGLLGLGVDCLGGDRLGIHMISATFVALGFVALKSNGASRSTFVVGLFAFFGTVAWTGVAAIAHAQQDHRSIELQQLVLPALAQGVFTAALLTGIRLTFQFFMNAITPQRTSSVSLTNRWSMLTSG